MIREMQSLLDGYWKWLKDQTSLRAVDDWIEITTPYLDLRNDCLQVYVKRVERGLLLSDDGYVLDDLEMSGCPTDRPPFAGIIATILNGLGIRRNGTSLEVETVSENFATSKHSLVQAMLAVEGVRHLSAEAWQETQTSEPLA